MAHKEKQEQEIDLTHEIAFGNYSPDCLVKAFPVQAEMQCVDKFYKNVGLYYDSGERSQEASFKKKETVMKKAGLKYKYDLV